MRIHKTDGRAIMGSAKGFGIADHGFKCWGQIMAVVAERAEHRAGVQAERQDWYVIGADYVN